MKKCPNCQKTFDDNMKFCQSDGTALVVVADNKPKEDPYATVVSNVSDLEIPPVEPNVEAKKEEVEVKKAEPKVEPEIEKDPYETMVANAPILPKEEDILDVLDESNASDDASDPMKTMAISGNTADNIKLNIPEEKPEEKPQPSPTSEALREKQKEDISEAKTMMSPEPPKFDEPKLSPPNVSAPLPPGEEIKADLPKPEVKETAPTNADPPKKTPSSPFDAEKPNVEAKPNTKDLPPKQNSAPIPSPFDNSMPPGYAPPSTPPFEPPKEALKPSALNVDKKKDVPKSPFADASNAIVDEKTDDLNVASAPAAGSGGKGVPDKAPFDNSAMPSESPAATDGQNQTLAIVSLVFAILSVPCCMGVVFSIVAIVTGVMAKNKAQENPNEYGGETLAKAGMIIGIATLVIGIILSILYILISLGLLNF